MSAPSTQQYQLAVQTLLIDRLTAEVASMFAQEGIETLVLKGPVLAKWLYPRELRPYGDSDLMVGPEDWQRAVALLERLGFSDHLGPMAHPRMESFASTAFMRGEDNVDLHCAIHGLDGDLNVVWFAFSSNAEYQLIGGAELRVPGKPALLLHVALHAAHHVTGKPIWDLERALEKAEDWQWREALELARRCDGVPTFSSGLRLSPRGAELARMLGIEGRRSVRHEVRNAQVPLAEGFNDLLAPDLSPIDRLKIILHELVPRPEFMRWRFTLARRGRLGLLASYPWRWVWLLAHVPKALTTVRRARRRG